MGASTSGEVRVDGESGLLKLLLLAGARLVLLLLMVTGAGRFVLVVLPVFLAASDEAVVAEVAEVVEDETDEVAANEAVMEAEAEEVGVGGSREELAEKEEFEEADRAVGVVEERGGLEVERLEVLSEFEL